MLQNLLTFSDLQHFIAIKFCLFVFLIASIIVVYKKWNPLWVLILASGLSATAYLIFAHGAFLPLFGLKADEVTIGAMYNTFAHAGFFKDFAYHSLPPFYPPLFFWIFAIPGKFLNWNGVQIAKCASFISLLFFPIILYGVQKLYAWSISKYAVKNIEQEILPSKISWILAPLFLYVFLDLDAIVGKPYEMISAALCISWTLYLLQDLSYKRLHRKRLLVYGVTGGLLFMTYYLWLILGAIAISFSGLFVAKKDQKYFYLHLFFVACISFIIASPYLLPLVLSYHNFGSENWQIAFFVLEKISPAFDFLNFTSWRGVCMLGGFLTLLYYRKNLYIRTLLLLFLSAYTWYLLGLSTLFSFGAPMQEFKGFDFFLRTILAFAAAFGLVELWKYLELKIENKTWRFPVLCVGLCVLSTQLFFGNFIDNPKIQARRMENKTLRPTLMSLIQFLQKDTLQKTYPLTLSSGIPEISAFVPLNQFVYYNQFNSHPAAKFSGRKAYLSWLQNAKNSQELFTLSKNSPVGEIRQYILFQNKGKDFYSLYFYVDDFPRGAKEEKIDISKKLFEEQYFHKTFENYEFVVFVLKSDL